MRSDLDDLLTGVADGPTEPIDVDELWAGGRRRRRRRRLTAVASGMASIAMVAVAVSAIDLGGGPAAPEVEPLGPSDASDEPAESPEDRDDVTDGDVTDEPVDTDDAEGEEQPREDAEDAGDEAPQATDEELDATQQETGDDPDPGPMPDPDALEDPCAAYEHRRGEAFVEVVAPVDGQTISGAVELIGCSSVYEGTVRYRVLSGDTVVVDGFTTATYGGPELGEFHEEIELPGTGAHTIEVFWESPVDGSEQDLVRIDVALG